MEVLLRLEALGESSLVGRGKGVDERADEGKMQ